jgi:hypothetical protein
MKDLHVCLTYDSRNRSVWQIIELPSAEVQKGYENIPTRKQALTLLEELQAKVSRPDADK